MEQKTHKPNAGKQAQDRKDRLKAALKANLKRRKAQARVRNTNETENSPETGLQKD